MRRRPTCRLVSLNVPEASTATLPPTIPLGLLVSDPRRLAATGEATRHALTHALNGASSNVSISYFAYRLFWQFRRPPVFGCCALGTDPFLNVETSDICQTQSLQPDANRLRRLGGRQATNR